MSAPATAPANTPFADPSPPVRRSHEPAIVRPGRNPRARSRVRTQWLALAAALVVLAGTVVAWALSLAAERVPVVSVAQPVQAGDVITAEDLTTSEVAIDDSVRGLVPAASLANLAGRVAAIDLTPGMLVSSGMWTDDAELGPDERTVGAVLAAGRYPSGLAHGSAAWAIDVRAGSATRSEGETGSEPASVATTAAPIVVRVLDVATDPDGSIIVTLAVPAASAVEIASLAATNTLALAGIPPTGAVTVPRSATGASEAP